MRISAVVAWIASFPTACARFLGRPVEIEINIFDIIRYYKACRDNNLTHAFSRLTLRMTGVEATTPVVATTQMEGVGWILHRAPRRAIGVFEAGATLMALIVSSCRFEIPAHVGKRAEYVLRKAAENPGVAYRSRSWVLLSPPTGTPYLPLRPQRPNLFLRRPSGQSQNWLQLNHALNLQGPTW